MCHTPIFYPIDLDSESLSVEAEAQAAKRAERYNTGTMANHSFLGSSEMLSEMETPRVRCHASVWVWVDGIPVVHRSMNVVRDAHYAYSNEHILRGSRSGSVVFRYGR